jgi:hypothetical protein
MPLSDNARSPGAVDRKVRTPPPRRSGRTLTPWDDQWADCSYTPTILRVNDCGRGRVLLNLH